MIVWRSFAALTSSCLNTAWWSYEAAHWLMVRVRFKARKCNISFIFPMVLQSVMNIFASVASYIIRWRNHFKPGDIPWVMPCGAFDPPMHNLRHLATAGSTLLSQGCIFGNTRLSAEKQKIFDFAMEGPILRPQRATASTIEPLH